MTRLNAVVAVTALVLALCTVGCQQKQQEEPAAQTPEPVAVQPAPFPHDQIPEAAPAPEPQPVQPQPALTETPEPEEITTIEPEPAAPKAKRTTVKPKERYAAPAKSSRTYTVRKGDTLQKISEKFYGTTRNFRKIYEANKDKLKDPNKVPVGVKLVIP